MLVQAAKGEEGEEAHLFGGEAGEEGGEDVGHRHRGFHHLLAPLLRHGCDCPPLPGMHK